MEVNPGKSDTWDCVYCEEKGLQKERNCDGLLDGQCPNHGNVTYEELEEDDNGRLVCSNCGAIVKMPFKLKLGKSFWIWRCPLQEINQEALFVIKLVAWSEAVHHTPSGLSIYEESNLFFEIRDFVIREQREAHDDLSPQKTEADQRRPKRGSRSPSSTGKR